ncbi:MAG: hypothetical protein NZM37_05775 [Sandaracinaceae bacterium]|nr:hypothetical protein [Sandaracinaceae bacterium]
MCWLVASLAILVIPTGQLMALDVESQERMVESAEGKEITSELREESRELVWEVSHEEVFHQEEGERKDEANHNGGNNDEKAPSEARDSQEKRRAENGVGVEDHGEKKVTTAKGEEQTAPFLFGLDWSRPLLPPIDPAAFPPLPPSEERQRPPVEVHGFTAIWITPHQERIPGVEVRDPFRLRFAVLRVDAHLSPHVRVLSRLGLTLPQYPLLDFVGVWTPTNEVAFSFGQMRMPFGASATTLAPQLVFPDRPRYVQAMLKATFRDVGVMLHSGDRGIADGILHYRLAVMNGGGRIGTSVRRPIDGIDRLLMVGRVLVDLGRLFTHSKDRVVVGVSYARVRDPAVEAENEEEAKEFADSMLGRRLVSYHQDRITQVIGADLTISLLGVWVQGEVMFLISTPTGGGERRQALGASLELAYSPDWHPYGNASLRGALRLEFFDPNSGRAGDESGTILAGLDFDATRGIRAGVYGGATVYRHLEEQKEVGAGEMTVRVQYAF